jgi:putative hydrolase of the HAD superfamily
VFVDDRAANLPPAEALGIRTIRHTDVADTIAQLDALLDRTAMSG